MSRCTTARVTSRGAVVGAGLWCWVPWAATPLPPEGWGPRHRGWQPVGRGSLWKQEDHGQP